MARPERHDADYFPFYCKDGRTLFILESQYGCKGTGFFTNVMRFLTLTPDHHYQLKEESDRLFFFSRCHIDEPTGLLMLEVMTKTGKIDKDLWVSSAVIVSEDLLMSLEEAYRKRKNVIITISDIRSKYITTDDNPITTADNPTPNDELPRELSADNPQRKGKERKGNKRMKKSLTPWSDEITLSESYIKAAQEKGLNNGQIEGQFKAFRDKALSKAWEYADWLAAWRNFITNQIEWGYVKIAQVNPSKTGVEAFGYKPFSKEDA